MAILDINQIEYEFKQYQPNTVGLHRKESNIFEEYSSENVPVFELNGIKHVGSG